MESNQLTLTRVDSTIWWEGLTANLTLTNTSNEPLNNWTFSFLTPHQLLDDVWGLDVIDQSDAGDGLTRITIQGQGYAQQIAPQSNISVGFNAEQGIDLGTSGSATADQVLVVEQTMPSMVHNHDHVDQQINHDHTDHQAAGHSSGDFQDITEWGNFHGSNNNSEHHELVGGRTAITTEALIAYNAVRAFAGLEPASIEQVGQWAFDNGLTNNDQAWGNDLLGVGLWYAMQGAKVGWIADGSYDPQILADLQRTARLGNPDEVMPMVRSVGHDGFADYLQQNGLEQTFINTLKMEPHYGGWMHGRTHGFLNIENGAIAHDINHLTVLGWDQSEPFMNDTFDWPQWPALEVSDQTVINYYQSIVSLGDPLSENLEDLGSVEPIASPALSSDQAPALSESDETQPNNIEPTLVGKNKATSIGDDNRNVLVSTNRKDVLTGNGEADLFVFTGFNNKGTDKITDFNTSEGDRIGFAAGALEGLEQINFKVAKSRKEFNQFKKDESNLIFFSPKRKLLYDQNGSDKGLGDGQSNIFSFETNPTLNSEDFVLL